ncbi:Outer membrane protein beta-barrel domain-containing protein [Chitinophaga costaii]|uniref:Outer membrane protein beta-barrel domain-containing protein n=1 Tax=Chitinophaga costaii TaxID=1335309 RepID=A0A1C4FF97_9BACT|nr:porin family protein [Chitinophaga costaii]PUZ20123.1 PorT family protein [Chitinophaga costaii]SCC54668.1 Outer membrane protein beta-barrel domain-containing protein [Chitinophaga costaii]
MIRKVLFTAITLFGLAVGAQAQDNVATDAPVKKKEVAKIHYGIKVGLDMTSIDGKGFSAATNVGFDAGVFFEYRLSKHWGLEGDLLYTRFQNRASNFKGYYNTTADLSTANNARVNLNYLSVPLLAQYKFTKVLSIVAGPQYSFLFYDDEELIHYKGAFKKSNIGVLGGLQVTLNNWRFYGRYVYGLNNLNAAGVNENYKWNTSDIQVGIGVTFK